MIDGGVLSQDHSYLALDKCKVQRARSDVMNQNRSIEKIGIVESGCRGFYFDEGKT